MGIYFSKEEIAIYGLKENDVIEIDEMLWEGKVK